MSTVEGAISRTQFAAMRCLAIDSVTATVVDKFSQAGIRTLLLKGASVARWLYSEDRQRTYGDVDLLVSPEQFESAEQVLQNDGYRHQLAGATAQEMTTTHGWVSPGAERVLVELHRTFHHVGAPDTELWNELSSATDRIVVANTEIETPNEAARCLLLALHVSRHGSEFAWPLRDLTLALEQVSEAIWLEAVALAERLDALPGMVSGLSLIPAGEKLCADLELPRRVSAALVIEAENMPKIARNLERLATTSGLKAKIAFALRKLFPTPAWMRFEYHLGECGPIRLTWAYVFRLICLLRDLPVSSLAWLRARRRAARLGAR